MRSKGTFILRTKLISIHKTMKRDPNKIFMHTDFKPGHSNNFWYLEVLKTLGLVEEVDARYDTTTKYAKFRRECRGFKLIKKELLPTISETLKEEYGNHETIN